MIPRLRHIYKCKELRKHQTWHAENRSTDGQLRSVVDGLANKHIERKWPDFKNDPRHVRFGGGTDGFSPFNQLGSGYTMWPVILVNYNIPPWLATKKEHLFLAALIPGMKVFI